MLEGIHQHAFGLTHTARCNLFPPSTDTISGSQLPFASCRRLINPTCGGMQISVFGLVRLDRQDPRFAMNFKERIRHSKPYKVSNKLYVRIPLPTRISKTSATGTRTRVTRMRAEHPNQLDYGGSVCCMLLVCALECLATDRFTPDAFRWQTLFGASIVGAQI